MFRYPFMILATALACAAAVPGQDNPLSTEAKSNYKVVRDFVIRAAEKMPEASYAFKPTPEVRSFGQLIGHIADDQYRYCSAVRGENKSTEFEQAPPPKAEMVAALKSALRIATALTMGSWMRRPPRGLSLPADTLRNSQSSRSMPATSGSIMETPWFTCGFRAWSLPPARKQSNETWEIHRLAVLKKRNSPRR